MAQTVIGIFRNSTEALNAKEHLLKNGFSDNKIDIARRTETKITDQITESRQNEDFGDKVSRFFSNLFGNDAESSKYARAAAGSTVITVHAQDADEAEVAADILDDYGAIDVDEYAPGDTDITTRGDADISGDQADIKTPIVSENQNPGRKEAQAGGIRVRSRIVERPVEETNRLIEEQVNTERTPASLPAPDAFRDVEEKQETVREILRDTGSATDDLKARKEADDLGRTHDPEHDKWDDVHRQRPGII